MTCRLFLRAGIQLLPHTFAIGSALSVVSGVLSAVKQQVQSVCCRATVIRRLFKVILLTKRFVAAGFRCLAQIEKVGVSCSIAY